MQYHGHMFIFRFGSTKELLPIISEMATRTDMPEFDHSCIMPVMEKARELESKSQKGLRNGSSP